jgi:sigma-B regulation protein RsbU (phosphoserine phosphatase)
VQKRLTEFESRLRQARNFVRRVMPTVALVAAILFILRTILGNTFLFGDNLFGNLLSAITTLIIFITLVYYGYKVLRWIKRKVFWRVRRRLLITYLFVGLTPIVLLSGLGFMFCYGLALNAMSASVMSQADATQKQTLETARTLADELISLNDDNNLKKWLDDRNRLLQTSLPGARIAVWRNKENAFSEDSKLTSQILNDKTKGLGSDNTLLGTKLPQWLKGKDEWSGFVFVPAQNNDEEFHSASFRAVVNRKRNGNSFTLLLIVPISRALVEQYRANTSLDVRPFFRNAEPIIVENDEDGVRIKNNDERTEEKNQKPFSGKDQLGETRNDTYAWVILPSTNWTDGQTDKYVSFIFPSSLSAVSRHFLQRGYLGQSFNLRLVLNVFGIIFLILEGTALIAAVLMTRAVTSMVHRLYRGTQFVKQGDFSHRIKSNSHDQLGELANAFNDMSSHIETLLQERVAHERLEKEVEIAAQVQSRLFPERVPDLLTIEIAAECRAARGVAGDYYDYIEVLPGLVALALGDVSGKGMSASLVMSNLQASLRSQAAITAERLSIAARAAAASSAGNTDRTLMRVMADANIDGTISRQCFNINKQLCRSTEDNRFATLFLALYEDRTRKLRYTNAGHNAPILVRANGTHERLSTGGMMVGAFDFAKYDEEALTINPDDILIVFSDGISEAESETGAEYTEERLVKFVIENHKLSAHELRDAIFKEIDKWAGTKERGDDQTILILKGRD